MSAQTINIGVVVQLKSGGPKMTVQNVDDKNAYCIWFPTPTDPKPVEKEFLLGVLKVVTETSD